MENYSLILGFLSLEVFLAMCFFAGMGIIISLLIDSQKRNQNSNRTPVKFSWPFLFRDNWKSILSTILLVLLTLRFLSSIFPDQFIEGELHTPQGMEKWLGGSALIGLSYNQLLQFWKKKTSWLQVSRK